MIGNIEMGIMVSFYQFLWLYISLVINFFGYKFLRFFFPFFVVALYSDFPEQGGMLVCTYQVCS